MDIDIDTDMNMDGKSNESPAPCGVEPMDCKVTQAQGLHGLGLG